MKKPLIYILFFLLFCVNTAIFNTQSVYAANGDKIWGVQYGGSSLDLVRSITQAHDGGYMGFGYTGSSNVDVPPPNLGGLDAALIKIDKDGNKEWVKTFGGSLSDNANSITRTNDNGYIVSGQSNSINGAFVGNHGGYDAYLMKIDLNGNIIWSRLIGGTSSDYFYYAEQGTDGYIYAAGYTASSDGDIPGNKGTYDILIAKYDINGNKIWLKTYGSSTSDLVTSAKVLPGGGIVVVGSTIGSDGDIAESNRGNTDTMIGKFDQNGNKVWIKTYGGDSVDVLNSVEVTADGGFGVAGYTQSSARPGDFLNEPYYGGSNDFLVMKLDSNGNKVWSKTFGGSGAEELVGIEETADGGFILGGQSISSNYIIPSSKGDVDMEVLKVNPNGVLQWIKNYGGESTEAVISMYRDAMGKILVVGSTKSTTGDFVNGARGNADFAILKLEYIDNETFVQVGIQSGGMSLTAPTLSSAFPGVTLNGAVQKTYATLSSFSVADLTGTWAGWKVSVSATALQERAPDGTWDTEGTRLSLPTGSMKIGSLSTITAVRGASSAPTALLITPTVLDGTGSKAVLSAAVGAGMDGYTIAFQPNTLEITVGPEVKIDAIRYPASPTIYESTLTWSIVSGP